jgi:uncharacterized membrane protein YphA (DoxX/SURF4 family)
MGIVQRFQHWSHHTREGLTSNREDLTSLVLRVILGLILVAKGIAFLSNAEELREMILNSRFYAGTTFLVSYVTFAHLFGGVFIIIGLLTRIVLLLQLPIIIGALVFILPAQGISAFNGAFFLTLLVLFLLVYTLIVGPGEMSMDDYLKKHLL